LVRTLLVLVTEKLERDMNHIASKVGMMMMMMMMMVVMMVTMMMVVVVVVGG
jgi:hypothetical protein